MTHLRQNSTAEKRADVFLSRRLVIARLLNILIYIMSLLLFMSYHYVRPFAFVIFAACIVEWILNRKSVFRVERTFLSAIAAAFLIFAIGFATYSQAMYAAIVSTIASLNNIFLDNRERRDAGVRRKKPLLFGAVRIILLAVSLAAFAVFVVTITDANLVAKISQGHDGEYEEEEETCTTEGTTQIWSDVTYESEYPNNTYTVLKAAENKGTFFYIHGGGFCKGDKVREKNLNYLWEYVRRGYNVVTIDYALAPEYTYPAPVIQAAEALASFVKSADTYGIDTDKIVIGGDSAGGQIAGQLCLLLTQPDYAVRAGILLPEDLSLPDRQQPDSENSYRSRTLTILDNEDIQVKGFVSISGVMDTARFTKTRFFYTDWLYNAWGRAYYDEQDFETEDVAVQSSILANVDENFPPSFISDGNLGTFTNQGKDLAEKLEKLGVSVTTDFPDEKGLVLKHDYQLDISNKYAQKDLEMATDFIASVVE